MNYKYLLLSTLVVLPTEALARRGGSFRLESGRFLKDADDRAFTLVAVGSVSVAGVLFLLLLLALVFGRASSAKSLKMAACIPAMAALFAVAVLVDRGFAGSKDKTAVMRVWDGKTEADRLAEVQGDLNRQMTRRTQPSPQSAPAFQSVTRSVGDRSGVRFVSAPTAEDE